MNSRLRYKSKDWASKKEEYENEIERLSNEVSSCFNVWYQEADKVKDPAEDSGPNNQTDSVRSVGVQYEKDAKEPKSTQTDHIPGLPYKTVATQTETCGADTSELQCS
ncbi:uncharacterized protein O3C94_010678 [Discoglossus pictus]